MNKDVKKILVVDDEYFFCKILDKYLSRLGYAVIISMNGEQALEMIALEKPDLVTLDIRMPGVNGYDILEKLRLHQSPVKIVVISAIDTPEMEAQMKAAGASAVFLKPVELEEIGRVVKELIG
ncbi:MAG: response regulator [Nitrospinae bacterium]|nr:response regulator [Nitrospinota bacterium]